MPHLLFYHQEIFRAYKSVGVAECALLNAFIGQGENQQYESLIER